MKNSSGLNGFSNGYSKSKTPDNSKPDLPGRRGEMEDYPMTYYQKRQNLERQMYKEIKKGNFEKADSILKKIVNMDVTRLNRKQLAQ